MAEIIAAFDVGGTFIKAALFDITGGLRPETYRNYPARADLPKKELLDHFYGILSQQLELAVPGDRLTGIGYSFPGPFSYQEGISLIRGQGKFDSLYQVNLRSEIRRRLREHPLPVPAACEEAILFENDATLFAMGEWRRESRYLPRYLAVTIGTGTGSAFLCDGCAVLSGPGVPPGGWIYSMPFQGTTVDDWISKRGLMRLAEQVGLRAESPLDVFEMAAAGDTAAEKVWKIFGEQIAQALRPVTESFRPDGVVIGGQLAKANRFFGPIVRNALGETAGQIRYADDTSRSVFEGIGALYQSMKKEHPNETV